MIFTGYRQPPFFDLHDIYRISTAPLFQFTWYLHGLDSPPFSIYVVFTGSRQPPFFNLRGIYNVIYRISQPPFFIYVVFTGSRQPPLFNLHGIYNVIYRILAATLFQFTWSSQDLDRLSLINLHVIYMICVLLPYNIYRYLSLYLHVSMLKFT